MVTILHRHGFQPHVTGMPVQIQEFSSAIPAADDRKLHAQRLGLDRGMVRVERVHDGGVAGGKQLDPLRDLQVHRLA